MIAHMLVHVVMTTATRLSPWHKVFSFSFKMTSNLYPMRRHNNAYARRPPRVYWLWCKGDLRRVMGNVRQNNFNNVVRSDNSIKWNQIYKWMLWASLETKREWLSSLVRHLELGWRSQSDLPRTIAPGLVETPMSKNWTAARKLWEERSPMGRGAQPEEIAQIASMIVASHYLTRKTGKFESPWVSIA